MKKLFSILMTAVFVLSVPVSAAGHDAGNASADTTSTSAEIAAAAFDAPSAANHAAVTANDRTEEHSAQTSGEGTVEEEQTIYASGAESAVEGFTADDTSGLTDTNAAEYDTSANAAEYDIPAPDEGYAALMDVLYDKGNTIEAERKNAVAAPDSGYAALMEAMETESEETFETEPVSETDDSNSLEIVIGYNSFESDTTVGADGTATLAAEFNPFATPTPFNPFGGGSSTTPTPTPTTFNPFGGGGSSTTPTPTTFNPFGGGGSSTTPTPTTFNPFGGGGSSTTPTPTTFNPFSGGGSSTTPTPTTFDPFGGGGSSTTPTPFDPFGGGGSASTPTPTPTTFDPFSPSGTTVPTINVDVSSTGGALVINPYHLSVEMDDGNTYYDEIVNLPEVITSYTQTQLEVKAKLTSIIDPFAGSEVQLVDSASKAKDGKKAFIYFEFVHSDENGASNDWTTAYSNTMHQLVVKIGEGTAKKVLTLDASDGSTPECAAFRARGAAGIPKEGMWTERDTVSIQVALTFTPVATSATS